MAGIASTVAVMGAGAWGTALAKVLADAGGEVTLWARRAEVADQINTTRYNPDYLPGALLPPSIHATADAEEALGGASTVLLGVPAQTMRANLERWAPLLPEGATLVSLAKGIELGTLMRMSQVIISVTGAEPAQVAVISGPNLASEIAECQPAATVVACSDSGRAVALQRALNSGYFRPYTNADVVGTEIGGACKNIIALRANGGGHRAGRKHRGRDHHPGPGGDHPARDRPLGLAIGATLAVDKRELVATCTSPRSRNRSFGERLGRGETLQSAGKACHVVEGVTSCESVLALASSYDVEMPLTDAVHRVCHKGLSVDEAITLLLGRRTKPE
ncbi:NAD(P)H-dependent glycerol-3-phosphate dehydrogenase [Mycobacterium tuberculosis CAS/NITR204]|uniref:Glycerol-3-phosphate dehydrogenase [NAD(P)+] n=1 Tax=Mycobacterium tuberculosis CAS/NITR204 TaxID=1310114 RepID=R4MHP9_MYCTX|nr:NAD(P)H-dependent glycerol-3-phosphate dehydrogenase [Mycobacterium tuberculosis CAS/NITR204]